MSHKLFSGDRHVGVRVKTSGWSSDSHDQPDSKQIIAGRVIVRSRTFGVFSAGVKEHPWCERAKYRD